MGSSNTLPGVGVSVSMAKKCHPGTRKSGEQKLPHAPNGRVRWSRRVQRSVADRRDGINHEHVLKKQNFKRNLNGVAPRNKRINGEISTIGNGDVVQEKVQTKCSTKWLTYGGCIPAILTALDTFQDLDEALKPWEERLSNKERSIILKEQTRWERALEIFEWFSKKGHELNVIHYNIMLRILGKARRWRRRTLVGNTYGLLISTIGSRNWKEESEARRFESKVGRGGRGKGEN